MDSKRDFMKYLGSMQQVAYVRPITYLEGRSAGMKAWEVKNGKLSFQIMADKCLDVCGLSYSGINMTFLSKPGLQGRNHYDTNGEEAIRSIMGGLFFTSGLENICAPCTVDGTDYPMHGRIRTTPGEHLSADARWEDDQYRLSVSGEMREAALFGENMVLRRTISTTYGEKTITVTDEIENESYREEPLMILYHINLGYPFLDENIRLYIPTRSVTARDQDGRGHEAEYDRMDSPKDNEPEYVFIHDLMTDVDGNTQVLAVNESLGLGLRVSFNTKYLPYFMEWKSTASGDYVIGLEPANSSVYGRPWHEEQGTVHKLAPFEKEKNVLHFTVLDGAEEIGTAVSTFKRTFGGII
ncbi:MAG: aldose 1-epimerase family protein [Lachnospiraceae bacterium]|nr:aldose 1-epimerase family protein [Lachnospiraceae bacterium]